MQSKDGQSELEALELELSEKEILLGTFHGSNEGIQKKKEILQEIKGIKDRIEKLKNKKDK